MATQWASFFAQVVEGFQAQPVGMQVLSGFLLAGSAVGIGMMVLYGIWKVRNEW